jgi:CubicO group peptidase (beta-lactamase class C family)
MRPHTAARLPAAVPLRNATTEDPTMKRPGSWCAGAILLVLLRSGFAAPLPSSAEVARQAHRLLVEAVDPGGPGAAVLVARGDDVLFREARGMAQIELGVPLQPGQVFRIGSDTKQFAAATVLKLVEEGRLSLTDPLSKFVPSYPNGTRITVHELLNHTSGVKDYTEIDGYFRTAIREDVDTARLIDAFRDKPVDFAPGTDWKYDNSGYVLIGAILEKTTGKPWYEAIGEKVLAPLSLAHTRYGGDEPIIAGRVAGYSTDAKGNATNAIYISMTQPGAAGGLVSSVDDLFHWMRALHTGKVLGPESYHRMITPVPTPSGRPTDYGYGIATREVRGEQVLEHAGRIPGFSSDTLYIPGPAISVVVLANSDSGRPYVDSLTSRLAAVALGRPYPERHPVGLTVAQMQGLAGVYTSASGERRTVTVHDGALHTAHGESGEHTLRASSPDELYFDEVLDRFTVTRDAAGRVTGLEKFPNGEGPAEHWTRVDGPERTGDGKG